MCKHIDECVNVGSLCENVFRCEWFISQLSLSKNKNKVYI